MAINLIETACKVAYDASKGKTRSTPINQLIEVFESEAGEVAFEKLKLHILYQNSREIIDESTSKGLIRAIEDIQTQKSDLASKKADLRRFLDYLRQIHRVFESSSDLTKDPSNRNFSELIKNFTKK